MSGDTMSNFDKHIAILNDHHRIYIEDVHVYADKIDRAQAQAEASRKILNSWSTRLYDICEEALEAYTIPDAGVVMTEKLQHELNVQMGEAARVRLNQKRTDPSERAAACHRELRDLEMAQKLQKFVECEIPDDVILVKLKEIDGFMDQNGVARLKSVYAEVVAGSYVLTSV